MPLQLSRPRSTFATRQSHLRNTQEDILTRFDFPEADDFVSHGDKTRIFTAMKAVAIKRYLPVSDPDSLIDIELPKPSPGPRDLLVKVEAISVNPVDTKVRRSKPGTEEDPPRVLGWDAAGVVEEAGAEVTLFKPGDEVFYAGSLTRPGANSEYHVVDERIVGFKPASLDFTRAAALPLTAITAWESLFDRLGIDLNGAHRGASLLVIGGAGGVGSITIQLAKLAGLQVIATASRPETEHWVRDMGADFVINHREPLAPQLASVGFPEVDYIASLSDTAEYWDVLPKIVRPQGRIVFLVDSPHPLDLNIFKPKSVTLSWEFMFTRPVFGTSDMQAVHALLNTIAREVDSGRLRTTVSQTLSPINAANLREVHAKLESGKTIGKITLAGW